MTTGRCGMEWFFNPPPQKKKHTKFTGLSQRDCRQVLLLLVSTRTKANLRSRHSLDSVSTISSTISISLGPRSFWLTRCTLTYLLIIFFLLLLFKRFMSETMAIRRRTELNRTFSRCEITPEMKVLLIIKRIKPKGRSAEWCCFVQQYPLGGIELPRQCRVNVWKLRRVEIEDLIVAWESKLILLCFYCKEMPLLYINM